VGGYRVWVSLRAWISLGGCRKKVLKERNGQTVIERVPSYWHSYFLWGLSPLSSKGKKRAHRDRKSPPSYWHSHLLWGVFPPRSSKGRKRAHRNRKSRSGILHRRI
jgi:hypothetical protein